MGARKDISSVIRVRHQISSSRRSICAANEVLRSSYSTREYEYLAMQEKRKTTEQQYVPLAEGTGWQAVCIEKQ